MNDQAERLIFESSAELVATAAARFIAAVTHAQEARGIATVALTGGSNGIGLLRELARHPRAIDWERVEIYWGDERYLPIDDPERNELQARQALFDHIDIDPARVHVIPASDGPFGDDIDAAAHEYARLIGDDTVFDVHLLGMGGEGHINSLFPHTDATAEQSRPVVAVTDSPKPPPRRITLTFPVINASREVWFLVSGAEKAEAVAAAAAGASRHDWPCAGAAGTENTVWFLDRAAAADLPNA
ncbi:6-phosphogluconolactonase [Gordonia sp. (in: high G+C Gram-positive bacteria)]|uniref:6-phosphogluconolactonase n=1 Tax=Gordonia sp. (in: high G+C Gram-positive bacteria) TaxID=84139 RepID=UPI0016B45155|nr:6-phosphogluconolactonase [Gordonia sp. (in: high G+C Gram-positive bacteria)]NLG47357.1 6-phosphogluconolactonase [Gordonia sp. (in: high G+C Gram-positive bacteria)]